MDIFAIFQSPIAATALLIAIVVFFIYAFLKSPESSGGLNNYKKPTGASVDKEEAMDFMSLINKGNDYLAQYEFDQALVHFQEALKFKNNDPSVHFKIGRIYLQKEDRRNATVAFKNVAKLNPDQIEAFYELARIYIVDKNTKEAIQAISQALSINPEHEETLKLKVKLHESENEYEKTLLTLKKLMEVGSQPKRYEVQFAQTLRLAEKHTEAIDYYEKLISKYPTDKSQYLCEIAKLYFELNQFTQAIDCFRNVVTHSDKLATDPVVLEQFAAALCNEGVRYYKEGEYDSAIRHFEEARRYDENNPDIYFNLGKACLEVKNIDDALKHLTTATQLNPKDAMGFYELAVIQDQQGMIDEAIRNYVHCLQLDSSNPKAFFGLGSLYGVSGEMDKAIDHLTQAVKLEPEFEDAIYNLGVALERKKEYKKAMTMYKKVLNLNKEHEQARSNLLHLQKMGK